MRHLVHMLLFAAFLAVFFATMYRPRGRRLRFGLAIWGGLAGGALGLALLMYPFT